MMETKTIAANGQTEVESIEKTAETMRNLIRNKIKPNLALIKEVKNSVAALETAYPKELRTESNLNIKGIDENTVIIHNSPHYGNTTLTRLGDILSTIKLREKTEEMIVEVRTTVNTNKVSADSIYFPGFIIGPTEMLSLVGKVSKSEIRNEEVRAAHLASASSKQKINGNDSRTILHELKNPIDSDITKIIEEDTSKLDGDRSKNTLRAR